MRTLPAQTPKHKNRKTHLLTLYRRLQGEGSSGTQLGNSRGHTNYSTAHTPILELEIPTKGNPQKQAKSEE